MITRFSAGPREIHGLIAPRHSERVAMPAPQTTLAMMVKGLPISRPATAMQPRNSLALRVGDLKSNPNIRHRPPVD